MANKKQESAKLNIAIGVEPKSGAFISLAVIATTKLTVPTTNKILAKFFIDPSLA